MNDEARSLGDPMMLSLFKAEIDTHTATMSTGLLKIEEDLSDTSDAESLMRAAHSIKGAARIVNIDMAVTLAHAMEDIFVSIQNADLTPGTAMIDKLLTGTDLLKKIGDLASDDTIDELMALSPDIDRAVAAFDEPDSTTSEKATPPAATPATERSASVPVETSGAAKIDDVKISTEHIDKLMNLAGEVMVRGNRLEHFSAGFKNIETQLSHLSTVISHTHQMMKNADDPQKERLGDLASKCTDVHESLAKQLHAFESFTFDFVTISSDIHEEAIASRMRPFSDGAVGFPRMVRDIAKSLNKEISFKIVGRESKVDRDILRELESPITHLLRNAVDHGIEGPDERELAGKERSGTLTLEASHYAGKLQVTVRDDGSGIDMEILKEKIVERELTVKETAEKLSDDELLQFMFLPGFSTTEKVTELSGRGFGLNIVSEMLQSVNGTISISSEKGVGTEITMLLPLTLSVVNSLVFELNNEYYAFPLASIGSTIELTFDMLTSHDGVPFVRYNEEELPLIDGHDALQLAKTGTQDGKMTAIVIGGGDSAIAMTIDRCVGEYTLVIKPLDPRLDPAPVISSASMMEDGNTVLSLDIENLLHMVNTSSGNHDTVRDASLRSDLSAQRILVVEDSITVREMERKMFTEHGYAVDTAIDGMDGWNALTNGIYDLVVSDVDMPRMNGIDLVGKMRADERFKAIPVVMVSYKDSEMDQKRGLDAGANFYMTKNSFHDNSLIEIINNLLKHTIHEHSNSQ